MDDATLAAHVRALTGKETNPEAHRHLVSVAPLQPQAVPDASAGVMTDAEFATAARELLEEDTNESAMEELRSVVEIADAMDDATDATEAEIVESGHAGDDPPEVTRGSE